jgi:RNA polymerase sigma factor (sigma-70 family)
MRRPEHASGAIAGAISSASSPSSILAAREAPDELRARLRMLDERSRQVIQMRFVDGSSFARIGEQLSMSETNARKVFSRAVADLKIAALREARTRPT